MGEVKEKEQAHKEYREAISQGHGAYLMDEETPVCHVSYLLIFQLLVIYTLTKRCDRSSDSNLCGTFRETFSCAGSAFVKIVV